MKEKQTNTCFQYLFSTVNCPQTDIVIHHMHVDFKKYQRIKDVNFNQMTPQILNAKPELRVKLTNIVNMPRQKKMNPQKIHKY
jgi:hypothetical protein